VAAAAPGAYYRTLRREPAQAPAPLLPQLWAVRSAQFKRLDPQSAHARVVYLGDSLTDWMAVHELVTGEDGAPLNRAISGDTSSGLLARVGQSFPAGVALCFLMIGRNDLGRGAGPERTAVRIMQVARLLGEKHGTGHVVVESVLPFAGPHAADAPALNDRLRRDVAARPAGLSFLDLYPGFLRDGQRDASLYADDTHLNLRGIERRLRLELEHAARSAPALRLQLRLPERAAGHAL
jgi:lysophospholipase L1-like esterase